MNIPRRFVNRTNSLTDGKILAGDIGGTSTRLGLFEIQASRLNSVRTQIFRSRDYPSLAKIITEFVKKDRNEIASACFGIAGPVRCGRVAGPNLAWETDAQALAHEFEFPRVKLINDLEANAHGICALTHDDLVTLQAGIPSLQGNRAIISVGTGLGEAGMFWNGTSHIPFACEGGHADFAPRNEFECELLVHLQAKFGRVSYERVLSGSGQQLLYEFLRDVKGIPEKPSIAEAIRSHDASAVITHAGLAGECKLCTLALDWYVSFYGAEAGNLALKMMATGGMYIGGGIAPKIIQKLRAPAFLNSFAAKGRMCSLLESMPVHVILRDTTALLGAARVGAHLCSHHGLTNSSYS